MDNESKIENAKRKKSYSLIPIRKSLIPIAKF
jgi:hypothetical protein